MLITAILLLTLAVCYDIWYRIRLSRRTEAHLREQKAMLEQMQRQILAEVQRERPRDKEP